MRCKSREKKGEVALKIIPVKHMTKFVGFDKEKKKLDAEARRKNIFGGHVAYYMKASGKIVLMEDEPDKYQSHFSEYIKHGIEASGIEERYKKVIAEDDEEEED
ncbi:ribosomal L18 carboxy-terminal region protein [Medicago truncatula]|uniref:Ribosomal L18 carboxy-terminal region protein n=1 Tax=Medicago truncatula TaxID=3880 RepID=A0A072V5U5_MEDTR|nr:ribosomal L18 carboxy-terminal region protein [Medicago truncatula]